MKYLSESQIIEINRRAIELYSSKEPIGVVDSNALNMIVEQPKQHVFGEEEYPTIIDKAAFIYQRLVLKHVFINANKRTAFYALNIFLEMNNHTLEVVTDEAVAFTVKIATDTLSDTEVKEWISKYMK